MSDEKRIVKREIRDHGVEHAQYFQGCGTSFTEFEECATGCGSSPHEALEDALEQLAQMGWDTSRIGNRRSQKPTVTDEHSDEHWHHISVLVRGPLKAR